MVWRTFTGAHVDIDIVSEFAEERGITWDGNRQGKPARIFRHWQSGNKAGVIADMGVQ